MTRPIPGYEYGRFAGEGQERVYVPDLPAPVDTPPPPPSAFDRELDRPAIQVHMAEGRTLNPGDTLVVRLTEALDDYEMASLQSMMKTALPANPVVVIVADGLMVATSELSDVVQRMDRLREFARSFGTEPIPAADVLSILDGNG